MAKVEKVVRFYRPVLVDEDEHTTAFKDDFWKALRLKVEPLSAKERRSSHIGTKYRGEFGVGTAPALRYLRVGRVRPPVDWPDTVDGKDQVSPLTLADVELLENAYLVPFGARNYVAVMSPIRGLVPITAIEAWMTAVLGLVPMGRSIELEPIVDKKVLKKLLSAVAVASLSIRVPFDKDLQLPDGSGSQVEQALVDTREAVSDVLDFEARFSFGRRSPDKQMGVVLKSLAERLAKASGPDKLDVSMVLQDGDGFKREHHSLIRDEIAVSAKFFGDSSHQFTVDEILRAMSEAIEAFKKR